MQNKLNKFVTESPWWTLLFTLIIVVTLGYGLQFLGFKNDYQTYFSKENPQLQTFQDIQNTYNKTDNVMFVVEPLDGKVFSPKTLATIMELTKISWSMSYASRVDSITNYQHTTANADELIVADLVSQPAQLNPNQLESLQQIATQEPTLVNRLISTSAHVTGVNVTLQLPNIKPDEPMLIAAEARKIAATIEASNPNIKLHITGLAMLNNAFAEASLNDNKTLFPIVYAIIVITLLITLRSFSAIFSVVILILAAIASALGIVGWQKLALNPTSAISPLIILTMAVADCVHILVTFLHHLRLGEAKIEAMQTSLKINFQPILLTSLTTVIGFLSMNFSDAPPFRDLGNIVALGVTFAWLLSITFLPAIMVLMPIKVRPQVKSKSSIMRIIAGFTIRNRKSLLIINGIIVIALGSFAPTNSLNDEFVKYFDTTTEFRQATDFLNANMGGLYNLELAIETGTDGGISQPEFLNFLQKLGDWLSLQPEVVHVNTMADTFKRLNKNLHADDPAWYKLPQQTDLAAQYLLLYEMSLPYGLDLNDQININKSGIRIIVSLQDMSSNEILATEAKIKSWLQQHSGNLQIDIASPVLMFAYIGKRNVIRMIVGTLLALILISVILMFAFKSVKFGLISLIPNLAPAAVAFGIWGLINGQIGLGLSVVTGMTLGIVVDDTVHFMSKYRWARNQQGLDPIDAVYYAFSTVGMALWVTSIVLISGFLILTASSFVMNKEMGVMTAITIATALWLDLLLLPPLLIYMEKKQCKN